MDSQNTAPGPLFAWPMEDSASAFGAPPPLSRGPRQPNARLCVVDQLVTLSVLRAFERKKARTCLLGWLAFFAARYPFLVGFKGKPKG